MTPSSTGLRERKKRDTYRAITTAARALVLDRGLDDVSVDEIAAAADVSTRTFFNYVSCKEQAVVGLEPGLVAELADDLRQRPEPAVQALRAVLFQDRQAEDLLVDWQLRTELVRRHEALLPRFLESLAFLETALTEALCERSSLDPATSPMQRIAVASVLSVSRSVLKWCAETGSSDQLLPTLDRALDALEAGFGDVR